MLSNNSGEEIRFAIVNPTEGDIIRIGACSPQSLRLQTEEGFETIYPVPENVGDLTHFWNGNDFIEYPEPQPSRHHRWIGGAWVDPRTQEGLDRELTQVKVKYVQLVNHHVGEIRGKFVTDIPFQDTTYGAKEKEAIAFLADPEPNMINYPYIRSEIGITAHSAYEICQIWLNMSLITHDLNAQLESIRVAFNNGINEAKSIIKVEQIYANFQGVISNFGKAA